MSRCDFDRKLYNLLINKFIKVYNFYLIENTKNFSQKHSSKIKFQIDKYNSINYTNY